MRVLLWIYGWTRGPQSKYNSYHMKEINKSIKYVDSVALAALIDKIGALRKSLLDADAVVAQTAAVELKKATDALKEADTALKTALDANTTEDNKRAARLDTLETVKVPAVEAKANAAQSTADKAQTDATQAIGDAAKVAGDLNAHITTFTEFKGNVEAKLDEIIEQLQNVVAAADIEIPEVTTPETPDAGV